MRKLILLLLLTSVSAWSQQMTLPEWNEEARTNIRLLPKYGNAEKTPRQKQSDEEFIAETMKQAKFDGSRTAASHSLVSLGFTYLRRGDIRTAMYRFNQAFLLDNANTDIYWGYGAVYMALGDSETAKKQYEEGLATNPDNTHLLTDLATWYLDKYYKNKGEEASGSYIDAGAGYLQKSYKLDPKDPDTVFRLSVFCLIKGDCKNARKYYKECKALGGAPITEAYTQDLLEKCGDK